MVAKKCVPDHLKHLPRLSKNADLSSPAKRKTMLSAARKALKKPAKQRSHAEELDLFKGLHACAYDMITAGDLDPSSGKTAGSRFYRSVLDELIDANLGLVYEMRRRYRVPEVDDDDYSSSGLWALYQAALAFDPWKGFRFSTYACNAIIRGYRHAWKSLLRRRRLMREYVDRTNPDLVIDGVAVQDTSMLRKQLEHVLDNNQANLTDTERFVIERRFLNTQSGRGDTLETIGTMVQLSKERVRQIQIAALKKLRETLEPAEIELAGAA